MSTQASGELGDGLPFPPLSTDPIACTATSAGSIESFETWVICPIFSDSVMSWTMSSEMSGASGTPRSGGVNGFPFAGVGRIAARGGANDQSNLLDVDRRS